MPRFIPWTVKGAVRTYSRDIRTLSKDCVDTKGAVRAYKDVHMRSARTCAGSSGHMKRLKNVLLGFKSYEGIHKLHKVCEIYLMVCEDISIYHKHIPKCGREIVGGYEKVEEHI